MEIPMHLYTHTSTCACMHPHPHTRTSYSSCRCCWIHASHSTPSPTPPWRRHCTRIHACCPILIATTHITITTTPVAVWQPLRGAPPASLWSDPPHHTVSEVAHHLAQGVLAMILATPSATSSPVGHGMRRRGGVSGAGVG